MTPQSWDDLAARFDLGRCEDAPGYVARGSLGEVWHLRTSHGAWAVKWHFPWAPADARPADIAVQLAAADAGLPLPRPRLTPDGDAVIKVGDRHARVYAWADLAPPVPLPATSATAAEAGHLLGLLHRLALPSAGPDDPWYTQVPRPADWAALTGRATREARLGAPGLAWAASFAAAQPRIAALTARLPPPGQTGTSASRIVCHRDFNPDNVRPRHPDGRLVVLDWENCGPLDPALELGYALFTWCTGPGQVSTAAITALLDGYAATAGTRPPLTPGTFTTAIAVHLNYLYVMAEQALNDPAQREFCGTQITATLTEYLGSLTRFLDEVTR
jgi:Ser/Thr protein kinase RdoA (MazF antagonist)